MKFNKKSLARMAVLSSMLGIVGSHSIQGMEGFEQCCICLRNILDDECSTPCFHHFHKVCILQNLKTGNNKCPLCNTLLRAEELRDIKHINFIKIIANEQEGYQSEKAKNESLRGFYEDNKNQAFYQDYLKRMSDGEKLDEYEYQEFLRLGEKLYKHD